VKAISLWEPWATLVAIGAKRVETRGWDTNYRGPLAIHAAKKWDSELKRLTMSEPFKSSLVAGGATVESLPGLGAITLPLGKIVAVCELGGTIKIERQTLWPGGFLSDQTIPPPQPERSFGDYTPGRYAWLLFNIVRLDEPIPFRGAQGFFDVPDEILTAAAGRN
jgi:hypothetical protein